MCTLYLILTGRNQDKWTWRVIGVDGKTVGEAAKEFRFYLEVLADARNHGFAEKPEFISTEVTSEMAS